jgi:uncharacterized membrane protein
MVDVLPKVASAPLEPRVADLVRRADPALSLAGVCGAVLSLCVSLTPSLLPRTWLQQGLITGLSAVIGYVLGITAGWLAGRFIQVSPATRRAVWWIVTVVAVPLVIVSLYKGLQWQRDIDRLMGQPPQPGYAFLAVLVVSVALFCALVEVGRGLRAAARALARLLGRWIPPAASRVTAVFVVAMLLSGLVNGVVYRGLLAVVTSTAEAIDNGTGGVAATASPTRSGGPQSLVSWSSLGKEGRKFVASGPSVAELTAFNGTPAKEPIRSYAGLDSASTIAGEAELAVRELRRAGAFARKVLCVVTTTGTGWVDPTAATALEYMYNGDTALVGIQYSYLPSWISFLVEKNKVEEAGRELFDQVYAEWSTLPADQRPKLLVFGESLGSLGSEAAFSGLDDLRRRADGVLWVGPTNANSLWAGLEADRDPGTREVLPTYQQGQNVRFAAGLSGLDHAATPADGPRIVYLQHASDPVVWWSPKLLLHKPDWLKERRGGDVLPAIRWYPFVTFLQVTADLVGAYAAPATYGHRYGQSVVAAWAAIAPPAGWTTQRTRQLMELIPPPR